MNRVLLLLSVAFIIVAGACTKADSPVSAEEDLRNGIWRRTSGRVTYKDPITRGDSTYRYDQTEVACRTDNSLQFKVSNVGTLNLGATKCTPAEPDTKEFQWQVTDNEKRIHIYNAQDYFPTDNVDADVITRTLGFLTIRYKVVSVNTTFHLYDTLTYTDVLRRN